MLLSTVCESSRPKPSLLFSWYSGVVLFGLATFYFYPSEPKHEDLGTYDNPEEAFIATQKALLMVSEQVNIGMESVAYLNEYEKTKKTIFK